MDTVDPTKPIHTPLSTTEEMKKTWEEYRKTTLGGTSPYITTSTTSTGITPEDIEQFKRSMSMPVGGGLPTPTFSAGKPTARPIPPYPGGEERKKPLVLHKYGATFTVEAMRGKLRCTARLCHDGFGTITAYGPDDKPENAVMAGIEKLRENYPEWGEMVDKLVTRQMTGPEHSKDLEEEHYSGIKSLYEPLPIGYPKPMWPGIAEPAAVKAFYDKAYGSGSPYAQEYLSDATTWNVKKP